MAAKIGDPSELAQTARSYLLLVRPTHHSYLHERARYAAAGNARQYRQQERSAFAKSLGNRENIKQQFTTFIPTMLSATRGDNEARDSIIELFLPEMEQDGWQLSDVVQQIWNGERDWHKLADDLHLDHERALLVLLILEELAQPEIESS